MRARLELAIPALLGVATLGALPAAHAAVVSTTPNALLSAAPVAINFGAATYDFTAASAGDAPGAAVATGGTAQIASLFGLVADFSAGSTIDQTGELYGFSSFPTASTIPNSAADDYIGLAFTLSDGVHFGYAEVAGPVLVNYGFETTPGTGIQTGASGGTNAVPEPSSVGLLTAGLAVLTATAIGTGRRQRRSGRS